jgi:hypothetical protein
MKRRPPQTRAEALRQVRMERAGAAGTLRFDDDGRPTMRLGAAWEVQPVWAPGRAFMLWRVVRDGRPLAGTFTLREQAVTECRNLIELARQTE